MGMKVSHVLFPIDTLVLYKATQSQMIHLRWLLMWLKTISKQKINLEKNELILVERVANVEDVAPWIKM